MENKQSITFKIFDNELQKFCDITVNLGDKYKGVSGKFVWKCINIGFGYVTFVQDINIEYHWSVPSSDRRKPCCHWTYEQTKRILQCPIYNWVKTTEPTRTIKY
jgi:hypothetical protein